MWIWTALMCLGGVGLQACATAPRVEMVEEDAGLTGAGELAGYEEGLQAFEEGDYQKAAALFEWLHETAQSRELSRRSLYALACMRLNMARTPEEIGQSISLWECWSEWTSEPVEDEDPRLLTPFLERIQSMWAPERQAPKAQPDRSRRKPPALDQASSKELASYKNLLQSKEREFERMKMRLDLKEREVRRLKHQIDALEAIHLKFQEKKKEVGSP